MPEISADVVLLDIEGTIGSIDFVSTVLFPYARQRMGAFVDEFSDDLVVQSILQDVRLAEPQDDPLATLLDWHDRDVKAGPLKRLQGLIWLGGYRAGDFKSHMYEDAVMAMKAWHAAGKKLCIYSSGSRQAQLLYFEHSLYGDLRPLITEFFDTSMGAKTESASYSAIAQALAQSPSRILFLTDNPREVDAAASASLIAIQIVREGKRPEPQFRSAMSFDEIQLDGR